MKTSVEPDKISWMNGNDDSLSRVSEIENRKGSNSTLNLLGDENALYSIFHKDDCWFIFLSLYLIYKQFECWIMFYPSSFIYHNTNDLNVIKCLLNEFEIVT